MKQFLALGLSVLCCALCSSQTSFADASYQVDAESLSQNPLRRFDLKGATQWVVRGGRLGQLTRRHVQESELTADSEKKLAQSGTDLQTLGQVPGPSDTQAASQRLSESTLSSAIAPGLAEFQRCTTAIAPTLSAFHHASDLSEAVRTKTETLVARVSRVSGMPCGEFLGVGRFDAVPANQLLRFFWIVQKDSERFGQWTEFFFLAFGQDSPVESRQSFRTLWNGLSARWILSGQPWDWNHSEWLPLLTNQSVNAQSIQESLTKARTAFASKRGTR